MGILGGNALGKKNTDGQSWYYFNIFQILLTGSGLFDLRVGKVKWGTGFNKGCGGPGWCFGLSWVYLYWVRNLDHDLFLLCSWTSYVNPRTKSVKL